MATSSKKTTATAADVSAMQKLRDQIARWNEGAASRTELTEADQETLTKILEGGEAVSFAARLAWRNGNLPTDLERLLADVTRYVKLTLSEDERHIGGTAIVMPSIESGAVRRTLEKLGTSICERFNAAIGQAEKRDRDAAAQHVWKMDTVDRYLQDDRTRHLVGALLVYLDARDFDLVFMQTRDTLRYVINIVTTLDRDFPNLPTHDVHVTLRAWLAERGPMKAAA